MEPLTVENDGAMQSPEPIGAFCKSFRSDFEHLKVLLATFAEHNPDRVRLTLSLPRADMAAFFDNFGRHPPDTDIVADEAYCEHDLSRYPGWVAQQICKLMSWQVVAPQSYVVLDSDCYLIRDLRAQDFRSSTHRFLAFGSTIRTVLKADNLDLGRFIRGELSPEGRFPKDHPRVESFETFIHYRFVDPENPGPIERSGFPQKAFGANEWIYYQPGQIFARDILIELLDFIKQWNLTAGDLVRISPWEYNWYGEFVAGHFWSDTEFRVSPFVHVQDEADLALARVSGLTEKILAERFVFMVMAARHLDAKRLTEPT